MLEIRFMVPGKLEKTSIFGKIGDMKRRTIMCINVIDIYML